MFAQVHPPFPLRILSVLYVSIGIALLMLAASLLGGHVPALLQPWLSPALVAGGIGGRVLIGLAALVWAAAGFVLTGINLWRLQKRAYDSTIRIQISLVIIVGWYVLTGALGRYGLILLACNAALLIYVLRPAVRRHCLPDDVTTSA